MCHTFFIHSPVNGHLDCFHVLAIANSAAMNIVVRLFLNYGFLRIFPCVRVHLLAKMDSTEEAYG